jgi:hypothetical protein
VGQFGLSAPYELLRKYQDRQMEWSGVFQTFTGPDSGGAMIAMPPVEITLPRSGRKVAMDFVLAPIDSSSVTAWRGLRRGDRIRFRATLTGMAVLLDTSLFPEATGLKQRGEQLPMLVVSKVELVPRTR